MNGLIDNNQDYQTIDQQVKQELQLQPTSTQPLQQANVIIYKHQPKSTLTEFLYAECYAPTKIHIHQSC